MARYWVGHTAASLGIHVGGGLLGAYIDRVAGDSAVPYLSQSARVLADMIRFGSAGAAAIYFGVGIPRVRRLEHEREIREREERITEIQRDIAENEALRQREIAIRQLENLYRH